MPNNEILYASQVRIRWETSYWSHVICQTNPYNTFSLLVSTQISLFFHSYFQYTNSLKKSTALLPSPSPQTCLLKQNFTAVYYSLNLRLKTNSLLLWGRTSNPLKRRRSFLVSMLMSRSGVTRDFGDRLLKASSRLRYRKPG